MAAFQYANHVKVPTLRTNTDFLDMHLQIQRFIEVPPLLFLVVPVSSMNKGGGNANTRSLTTIHQYLLSSNCCDSHSSLPTRMLILCHELNITATPLRYGRIVLKLEEKNHVQGCSQNKKNVGVTFGGSH